LKVNPCIRRTSVGVIIATLAIAFTTPANAGPIPFNTFLEFGFSSAGTPATGCDPADPDGPFCVPSGGTPTGFINAPPWTFLAPAQGAILTVTDAFSAGDRFQVFDFGASIGLTSAPAGSVNCGSDPVLCLAAAGSSKGLFNLAAGNHSITITPTLAPDGGGAGYLRVDPVPEPVTWALFGTGLVALGLFRRMRRHNRKLLIPVACLAIGAVVWFAQQPVGAQPPVARFAGPTSSQPLALPADDSFLAVVNPDNNSVSFFDLTLDANRRIAEVPVQTEPNGVAVLPNGSKAYVANTVSGTVSVIPLRIANGLISKPSKHITVGTEPYGLALTPNGSRLYVSNSRSNSVSVIDTATDTVITTIQNVGPEPRGLAITNDGDADDTDETVYVTQFLSLPVAGKVDGQDDAKAGHVTIISTATNLITGQVTINPIADTGFLAAGDAIARIPIGNPPVFNIQTGAYPNQLNNLAIKGDFVFVPNVGASPNGALRFDVNTHSLLSTINRLTATDAGTINMHLAVKNQTNPAKLFNTLPWAMAFKHTTNEGYVVIAASNIIIKVAVDPVTGVPTVQNDPIDPTKVLQIKVGKNPRGIVVNSADTRAYVMNYVSRDLTVLDLVGGEHVQTTKLSANLPVPGTLADTIQIGKELYNTSVGEFDPAPGTTTPIVGRMSNNGWGACATCHPNGLTDDVVWIFPSGPKRTIPQHTDFDRTDPARLTMRPLNFSAERDEEEDFELNIRAVSGGLGMIVLADGITQDLNVNNFTPLANGGRNQLKVRGVGGWDAIKAYVQFGIRAPISPVSKTEPDVIAGKALFTAANCQSCHGSAMWTQARVRFTPPPGAGIVNAGGEIIGELRSVGTFNAASLNEVRQNPTVAPLGANGYVPPSLLSIFAFPQTFFHNGQAASLDEVLNNVTHRSAGTSGVDILTNPADRAKIVRFLLSIDANSAPIP